MSRFNFPICAPPLGIEKSLETPRSPQGELNPDAPKSIFKQESMLERSSEVFRIIETVPCFRLIKVHYQKWLFEVHSGMYKNLAHDLLSMVFSAYMKAGLKYNMMHEVMSAYKEWKRYKLVDTQIESLYQISLSRRYTWV